MELFEFVFAFLFEVVFEIIALSAEYALFRTNRRGLMWALGLVGIAVLVWWRGVTAWRSWILAAGWLAVLVYFDRRMTR